MQRAERAERDRQRAERAREDFRDNFMVRRGIPIGNENGELIHGAPSAASAQDAVLVRGGGPPIGAMQGVLSVAGGPRSSPLRRESQEQRRGEVSAVEDGLRSLGDHLAVAFGAREHAHIKSPTNSGRGGASGIRPRGMLFQRGGGGGTHANPAPRCDDGFTSD